MVIYRLRYLFVMFIVMFSCNNNNGKNQEKVEDKYFGFFMELLSGHPELPQDLDYAYYVPRTSCDACINSIFRDVNKKDVKNNKIVIFIPKNNDILKEDKLRLKYCIIKYYETSLPRKMGVIEPYAIAASINNGRPYKFTPIL